MICVTSDKFLRHILARDQVTLRLLKVVKRRASWSDKISFHDVAHEDSGVFDSLEKHAPLPALRAGACMVERRCIIFMKGDP